MSDADDPGEAADGEEPVRDVVRVDGDEPSADGADGGDDGPPVGRDGVVDPEDLDIRDRDGVDETDDGRYVISTGGGRDDRVDDDDAADPTVPEADDSPATPPERSSPAEPPAADGEGEDPLAAVAAELGALSSSHGFALAVAAGGETDTLRVASAAPTDTLATALRWYARRVNPGAPPEETIRALLDDSDLDVR